MKLKLNNLEGAKRALGAKKKLSNFVNAIIGFDDESLVVLQNILGDWKAINTLHLVIDDQLRRRAKIKKNFTSNNK